MAQCLISQAQYRNLARRLSTAVSPGETIRCVVSWENIGNVSGTFDLAVMYGDGTDISNFVGIGGEVKENVSLAGGASAQTNIDLAYTEQMMDALGGVRDALVLVGDYDAGSEMFTYDDYHIAANAVEFLVVEEAIAQINNVTFQVV